MCKWWVHAWMFFSFIRNILNNAFTIYVRWIKVVMIAMMKVNVYSILLNTHFIWSHVCLLSYQCQQSPNKHSKPNDFHHTLSKSAPHRHKRYINDYYSTQYSTHGYCKQTLLSGTVKIKLLFIMYASVTMLVCMLHVWTRQELGGSRIIFVSKATASTLTPTQARQTIPERGFLSHLAFAEPVYDPVCDSSRLCVTASVLLAFHKRPQLPEIFSFSSHGSVRETSPHLKESLPAINETERKQPLGSVTSTVYNVWYQKWLIAHEVLRLPTLEFSSYFCLLISKWMHLSTGLTSVVFFDA